LLLFLLLTLVSERLVGQYRGSQAIGWEDHPTRPIKVKQRNLVKSCV